MPQEISRAIYKVNNLQEQKDFLISIRENSDNNSL